MSKEVEKRKKVRAELLEAYEKMWELDEKCQNSTTFDEYYEWQAKIDEQNKRINDLETEYNKLDYAINILKQARIDVLEK